MFSQLFKIIWKQRRNNIWIVLELIVVFVLLWYIVDFFSVLGLNTVTPNGFNISGTYLVKLSYHNEDHPRHVVYEEDSDEPYRNIMRLAERIRNHPGVDHISIGSMHYPYCVSNMTAPFRKDSLRTQMRVLMVTPDYFRVFRVKSKNGDSPEYMARAMEKDVIITKTVEEKLFPGKQAKEDFILDSDSAELYISAVANPVKLHDYTRPEQIIYLPFSESVLKEDEVYEEDLWDEMNICFSIRPGVQEKPFLENIRKDMKSQPPAGNYIISDIVPISQVRKIYLKDIYKNLTFRSVFAVFFLLSTFLGIIGTFWLKVKRRRPETGIRIAFGSTKRGIMKYMMTESLLLLLIASIPALIICLNLVKMDILPTSDMDITTWRILSDCLITFVMMAAVILLATWYPARRAAKVQPAEALHYE